MKPLPVHVVDFGSHSGCVLRYRKHRLWAFLYLRPPPWHDQKCLSDCVLEALWSTGSACWRSTEQDTPILPPIPPLVILSVLLFHSVYYTDLFTLQKSKILPDLGVRVVFWRYMPLLYKCKTFSRCAAVSSIPHWSSPRSRKGTEWLGQQATLKLEQQQ